MSTDNEAVEESKNVVSAKIMEPDYMETSDYSLMATVSDISDYQSCVLLDEESAVAAAAAAAAVASSAIVNSKHRVVDWTSYGSGSYGNGNRRSMMPHSTQGLLAIYTEWANHYLEKAGFTNFVTDLQTDLSDGTILADIIMAVTGEKVQNIRPQPKASQQVENLSSCLKLLSSIGVITEGILAKDINERNLKAILGLLFNLSRYKQQLKRQSSSASTPSAVSSNGSTLSGNNNIHKSNK